MTPKYLEDDLPTTKKPLYGGNNWNTYHYIFCHTTRYMNSFYPDSD